LILNCNNIATIFFIKKCSLGEHKILFLKEKKKSTELFQCVFSMNRSWICWARTIWNPLITNLWQTETYFVGNVGVMREKKWVWTWEKQGKLLINNLLCEQ